MLSLLVRAPRRAVLLLALAALPLAPTALAQTAPAGAVGIGTTAPDASAALDIVSSDKGLLLPRVPDAKALPAPAAGLIVYQTGGSGASGPGFWYNGGTAAAPQWRRLTDSSGLSYDAASGLQVGPGPLQTSVSVLPGSTSSNGGGGGQGPFMGSSTSARTEVVYPAAVLQGWGLRAGAITSLSYYVSNKLSSDTYTNFTLALGHTTASSATATFSGGLTPVYTGNVTVPATGQVLQLVFNTGTFVWDGTSNLVVQTCFQKTTTSADDLFTIDIITSSRVVTAGTGNRCATTSGSLSGSRPKLGFTQPGASYALAPTAGVAGQVLTQQANGTVTFQDPQWVQEGTSLYPNNLSSKVGIGTTAPALGLDVATGSLGLRTAASWDHLYWEHDGALAVMRAGGAELGLSVQVGNGGAGSYGASGQNYREGLRLLADGRVGLGTGSPAAGYRATVGAASPTDNGLYVGLTGSSTATSLKLEHNGSNLVARPATAGGSATVLENTAGPLLLNAGTSNRVGVGSAAPAARLEVQGGANADGSNDPVALSLAWRNGGYRHFLRTRHAQGSTSNALEVYLNNSLGAEGSSAPGTGNILALSLLSQNGARLGVGTAAPRGPLDVPAPGDLYLIEDPNVGESQSVYLPGHLFLAPYNSGTPAAYVQARIPNPTSSTSLSLIMRTTFQGNLRDALTLYPSGSAAFYGTVTANGVSLTSDARFKEQVRPLAHALNDVLQLRGVRYQWNALGVQHGGTAGKEQIGLLAQEVEKVFPELVSTDPQGYKSVNYAQLTPVLLEALREQQRQLEVLRAGAAQAAADHASLLSLQEQVARLQQLLSPTSQVQR
ncbi:tail fiber domain-containing protein [Hymenobacter lutimineralis]|uniref:Tail fiber domain-containing protein n=1 Tax=Hymenobacter lutimineralis TaxID=2606448 RepID=A0A5D6VGE7_9BACT|nr:tail fiber domain-containing protein [Hymenobacter lutimineralis]TYZ14347.1 tail fiber domain-containing protein [Hymenobacter lutimineralis]